MPHFLPATLRGPIHYHLPGNMIFAVAFGVAVLLTLLIVRSQARHARLSHDHDLAGIQKFHAVAVPRVGGLGIFIGTLAAVLRVMATDGAEGHTMFVLLTCSLPVFLSGVVEDFTKRVPARSRLVLAAVSATLAIACLGIYIERVDLRALQWLTLWPLEAMALTVFAVTGVTNAVNLIDGFNGLASMCVMLMAAVVGFVAWRVHDHLVCELAFAIVGAVLGFFVFNFPRGRIFLGDGGAYFIGFMVAELSLLLVQRNGAVSAIFPLLICAYPIFETVFTMYRRRFIHHTATGLPDAMHMHHLVFRRLTQRTFENGQLRSLSWRNSMTSPFLWLVCSAAAIPAACFWSDTRMLLISIGLFMLGYVTLYRSLSADCDLVADGQPAALMHGEFGIAHSMASSED